MRTPPSGDAAPSTDETRERVKYLLAHLWRGRQREMARSVGVTQGLLSKVVNGQQAPGPRLLTALAAHPDVNGEWLRTGAGQPLYLPEEGSLPVSYGLLPGPPLRYPHLLSGARHPVARVHDRETRYWLLLGPTSPLVREPGLRLASGDLLLFEADAGWTRQPNLTHGRLCGVRFPGHLEPCYEVGVVTWSPQGAGVRLFGGAFVPAPPPPPKRTKSTEGVHPPKTPEGAGLRRTIRPLKKEREKKQRREAAEATARQAAAEGLSITQDDIVAVQVYMTRPELSLPLSPW